MRRRHAATRHGDNGTQARGGGDRQPGMLPPPRHGSCPSWDTVTNHQTDREAQGHTGSHNMPRTRATTPSTRRHTGGDMEGRWGHPHAHTGWHPGRTGEAEVAGEAKLC